MLGTKNYSSESGVLSNAITIASTGTICFVAIQILINTFKPETAIWSYISYCFIGIFIVSAVIYLIVKKIKKENLSDKENEGQKASDSLHN